MGLLDIKAMIEPMMEKAINKQLEAAKRMPHIAIHWKQKGHDITISGRDVDSIVKGVGSVKRLVEKELVEV